jgi:peroxisomal 2,4-dienoyl-CoA reductase
MGRGHIWCVKSRHETGIQNGLTMATAANRVLFITGGAGSIGSAQTRALVHLGADACIIGRNVEKTEAAAKEIAKVRSGARVLGIGGVDVRNVGTLLFAQNCSSSRNG